MAFGAERTERRTRHGESQTVGTGICAELHRTLSTPRRALLNMTLFLILIGIIAAVLVPQLQSPRLRRTPS